MGKVTTNHEGGKAKPNECYKCRGKEHYVIVCPMREQRLSLTCENKALGDYTNKLNTKELEVEIPKETLEGSTLPLCFIRRVLTREKKKM